MKRKQIGLLVGFVSFIVLGIIIFLVFPNQKIEIEQKEYTVSFKIDNVLVNEVKVKENEIVPEYPVEKKENYFFDGWYKENERYDFNTIITEDITLNASWIELKDKVVVTFLSNNQIVKQIALEKGNLVSEYYLEETSDTYFDGWYRNDEIYDFTEPVIEDITLVANWGKIENQENHLVATFYIDDLIYETQRPKEGENLEKPNVPSKEGYIFKGWYTKDNIEYNFNKKVTENIKLIARWEAKKEYTVTFMVKNHEYAKYKVFEGDKVDNLEILPKEGEVFEGWYLNNSPYDFNSSVQNDFVLEAVFRS